MVTPSVVSPAQMVRSGLCSGCGTCVAASTCSSARMDFDAHGRLRPSGSPRWLNRRTEELARLCPFSPTARNEDQIADERLPTAPQTDPRLGRYTAAFVGYANTCDHARGSSGGLVTWTAKALLAGGHVDAVAHVGGAGRPGGPEPMHAYRLSLNAAELEGGARSRYYPVEMSGVLRDIRAHPGRYAVIGVPCFIKAIHLLRARDRVLRERIVFTLGLVCGHMKSARMADSFAWQMDARTPEVRRLDYRIKDPTRPANLYTTEAELTSGEVRRRDWWSLADGDWGAGFFQYPACDMCDDVMAETADISFGDAWAEPYAQDGRGTNVVVARSPLLADLLRRGVADGELSLQPVNADFVARTQAAGLRHRREGLAYRLTWPRLGVRPRKRVAPRRDLPLQRLRIYRLRAAITAWSHRIMWLARTLRLPRLYLLWARAALSAYHGAAYGRRPLGRLLHRGSNRPIPEGPA